MSNSTALLHVDADRLRRAASRHVKRIGADRFLVEGRHEPEYLVDLNDATPCCCRDAQIRGGHCLHELAARLCAGDGDLVLMLGQMLFAAESEVRTLRAHSRKLSSA